MRSRSIRVTQAEGLTRRRFGLLLAAATGAAILPRAWLVDAVAQDAGALALERLAEYPELNLVSTDDALMVPEQVSAGRYLVTIENRATLGESAPNFILLPEGQTTDELLSEPPDPQSGLPPWFYTETIVGMPVTPIGATAQAIVDLAPGRYAVWGEPFQPFAEIEVVAGSGEVPLEPITEVTITMTDGAIGGVPKWVPPGKHLWKVESAGAVPHRFQLYGYPEPLTVEQLLAAFALPEGATPPPGVADLTLAVPLGGFGVQSAGQTGWPVLDLTPGTYVALCTLGSEPHFLAGEVAIFTVAE
jgi:hypothetical protein